MQHAVGTGVATMEASMQEYDGMTLFLDRILGQMKEMDGRFLVMMGSSSSVSDALNQTSAMIEEVAAGCEEVLASTEIQQQSIYRMNDHIQETTRDSLSLRSVISQFKLPDPKDAHHLQAAIDRWVECALGMRAIMVAMIDSRDADKIRYWDAQKAAKAIEMSQCLEQLGRQTVDERDRTYFIALEQRWQEFNQVKEQNAKWMLDAEYEKAKNGLTNKGRQCFKGAMDVVNEWMELEE